MAAARHCTRDNQLRNSDVRVDKPVASVTVTVASAGLFHWNQQLQMRRHHRRVAVGNVTSHAVRAGSGTEQRRSVVDARQERRRALVHAEVLLATVDEQVGTALQHEVRKRRHDREHRHWSVLALPRRVRGEEVEQQVQIGDACGRAAKLCRDAQAHHAPPVAEPRARCVNTR